VFSRLTSTQLILPPIYSFVILGCNVMAGRKLVHTEKLNIELIKVGRCNQCVSYGLDNRGILVRFRAEARSIFLHTVHCPVTEDHLPATQWGEGSAFVAGMGNCNKLSA